MNKGKNNAWTEDSLMLSQMEGHKRYLNAKEDEKKFLEKVDKERIEYAKQKVKEALDILYQDALFNKVDETGEYEKVITGHSLKKAFDKIDFK